MEKTINVKPNNTQLYPLYCQWIDDGNEKQKEIVKDILKKLIEAVEGTD